MKNISISTLFSWAFVALLGMTFFSACSNADKQKREALDKETAELHNNAMKEVADMNRVAREIKQFLLTASMTPEQNAVYMDALTAMGQAENAMNDWMVKQPATDALPDAEAIKVYEAQKEFLTKNLQDIRTATEAGKKLMTK